MDTKTKALEAARDALRGFIEITETDEYHNAGFSRRGQRVLNAHSALTAIEAALSAPAAPLPVTEEELASFLSKTGRAATTRIEQARALLRDLTITRKPGA